ncbi:CbrC family protein [Marinicella gelatinilytica]|uniref:CbrC family protein n=1 Tax=Marinicella gelatinilytica TaxID=2996017 RepID=UPI0022608437|nr:CbrC family protein [Marinicella gelatinilytica]MCX7545014.1 CbrC family protein [Marinicella gelatinilytica]
MSKITFRYFRDPDNFSFKLDKTSACSICGNNGIWFDAGGFYGEKEIDCICDECLIAGKLENLGIETNEAFGDDENKTNIIIYNTPALPTWQNRVWPYVNGDYCVFERLASKADFINKNEFINSFSAEDEEQTDLDWLWQTLPNNRITNHLEGNFNVSVYLFTCQDRKYCTWDVS